MNVTFLLEQLERELAATKQERIESFFEGQPLTAIYYEGVEAGLSKTLTHIHESLEAEEPNINPEV